MRRLNPLSLNGAYTYELLQGAEINRLQGIRDFENSLAFVGRQAEEFIDGINADVAFLSCRGISPDGYLTDSSLEEASIRRVMLRRAKRRVLLCDTTKFDMGYTYNIARLDELDEVISEK